MARAYLSLIGVNTEAHRHLPRSSVDLVDAALALLAIGAAILAVALMSSLFILSPTLEAISAHLFMKGHSFASQRIYSDSTDTEPTEEPMKIVVIGATGTIGGAVVKLLRQRHEIVTVARSSGDYLADITEKASIETTLGAIGKVDAIVSAAGSAVFEPLTALTDFDFEQSLHDKLMGQVNVVRAGAQCILPGGSITITSGTLAQEPIPGSAVISLVNAALEGFCRAAALELESAKVRVNVVSPPWVKETLVALNMDPSFGMPADEVAKAYARSLEGSASGKVINARDTVA